MGRAATDTREKLIETAGELIWLNSYGSVSVDDICKKAGVNKGSFYHYFKSKTALALAVMDEHSRRWKPALDEAFSPALLPLQRLEAMADLAYLKQQDIYESYGRVCGCPFATMGTEMAGQDDLIAAKVEEIFTMHTRYVESALRDLVAEGVLPAGSDIQAKARSVGAYVMGQMMMARIQNSLTPLQGDLKTGILNIIGIQTEDAVKKTG